MASCPRDHACFWALLLPFVAIAPLGRAAAAPDAAPIRPTCAWAASPAIAAEPWAAELEASLLSINDVNWVERPRIQSVVHEQQTAAMFGPAHIAERELLGRLVKADLLLLISANARSGTPSKPRVIEVAVCETANGLRLLTNRIVCQPGDEAAAAGAIGTALRSAIARAPRRLPKSLPSLLSYARTFRSSSTI